VLHEHTLDERRIGEVLSEHEACASDRNSLRHPYGSQRCAASTESQSSSAATKIEYALAQKSTVLYLDIGASVSVGVQPTPRDPRANRQIGAIRIASHDRGARGVALDLTELGCPASRSRRCFMGPIRVRVARYAALRCRCFLHAHQKATSLSQWTSALTPSMYVSIILTSTRMRCASSETAPATASPSIALTHRRGGIKRFFHRRWPLQPLPDDFDQGGFSGGLAKNSVAAMRLMNSSLSKVYGSFHIRWQTLLQPSTSRILGLFAVAKKETTRVNVQYELQIDVDVCAQTYGPNIHPNDLGLLGYRPCNRGGHASKIMTGTFKIDDTILRRLRPLGTSQYLFAGRLT